MSASAMANTAGVLAIGQPMPRGVELPDTPQPAPQEGSVGIAIIGLGSYALRQMMPAILQTN